MVYSLIKTGAALVAVALLASPAYALSPLSLNSNPSLLVLVEDEENKEIWRDLRPDVTPPEAAVGKEDKAPQAAPQERPKEEGKDADDIEEEEMKRDGLPVPE